jgi:plastocyanin
MKRILIPISLAACGLVLAACGSSSSGSATSSAAAAAVPSVTSAPASSAPASSTASSATGSTSTGGITIKSFGYSGQLTVAAGAKITVTNNDSVAHTLTDKKTGKFDTGNIAANGGTGTFTAPTTPGTYAFGCTYHPEMAGTLVVQ